MKFDLKLLANRLHAAAERAQELTIEVTTNELVLSRGGHGTGRSESLPFAVLFLQSDDLLGQALDRLERQADGSPAPD